MKALIVSNALDTNGQNARYAKASEKWGTDPTVLKALAIGLYDPAGVVGRFKAAADKYGELRIRSVHRSQHIYQQMPADIVWDRKNVNLIKELAAEADIIHLNNNFTSQHRKVIPWGKPMLLHHHGSLFRSNPKTLLDTANWLKAVQCVSTVDLMKVAPDILHWAPTAYDIDWLADFAKEHRDDHGDTIRIVQCPTDGGAGGPYKSTSVLQAAVARLQARGLDIELVIVSGKPWLEALAIKATADIYFDQVKLGYGCNAVEAWGMGIPVIAGADAWTLAKMREVYGSADLPFYEATEDTIEYALLDLVTSKMKRTHYAKRGMAHVRKFHDERPALARLATLYHKAIHEPAPEQVHLKVTPVTFRAKVPQILIGGSRLTFSNGEITVDKPAVVRKLRLLAIRHPKYGIEEVA